MTFVQLAGQLHSPSHRSHPISLRLQINWLEHARATHWEANSKLFKWSSHSTSVLLTVFNGKHQMLCLSCVLGLIMNSRKLTFMYLFQGESCTHNGSGCLDISNKPSVILSRDPWSSLLLRQIMTAKYVQIESSASTHTPSQEDSTRDPRYQIAGFDLFKFILVMNLVLLKNDRWRE